MAEDAPEKPPNRPRPARKPRAKAVPPAAESAAGEVKAQDEAAPADPEPAPARRRPRRAPSRAPRRARSGSSGTAQSAPSDLSGESADDGPSIPDELPVLPLHGTVPLPLSLMPLVVGQERSVKLIDSVMRGDRMMAMFGQRGEPRPDAGPEDLHDIGAVGVIHQMQRAPDGSIRLLVQGLERVAAVEYTSLEPFLVARIEQRPDEITEGVEVEGLRQAVVDLFKQLVDLSDELPGEMAMAMQSLQDPRQVVYLAASTMPISGPIRQELLELDPLEAKMRRLIDLLQHELAVRSLSRKITDETRERMSKAQREFFLREQARAIQKELGEDETPEIAELRRRLDEAGLSEEARREADRELERLVTVPPASPEHGIIRNYLDTMASLPWSRLSGGEIDVTHARGVLDSDHYDLEKIKDRLIEYLAVKKLRDARAAEAAQAEPDSQSDSSAPAAPDQARGAEPILCFVGPPGVGKTSLGQSIARALGRKFIRISLGGVHDEAEIRGHRRTYVGAMPGRIITGVKRAESRDPVFVLDEIDKVGADWRGDPSSALLEVLDPAQNGTFVDNYLNVAFDLSKVLFICTANNLDTVSPPLRDRMEVLQLSGYTDDEKVHIASRHLVPKQRLANGLTHAELTIEDEAIRRIIRGWTREAGVRNLEREIGSVCRKVAKTIAEGRLEPTVVTAASVDGYLGRPRFHDEIAERTERPGVATGLAWTPVGGDVLFVEATMMPSQEERLILTGMLGDVMRESAQAALSYLRSGGGSGEIDPAPFTGKAVHVHVPAGAIPKDGPSAGVTMVTALASLASGRCVRSDLAMTGEVTLRGKVLPVGGIKEKVLAAHRAGVKTIILPRRNERDLEDIPPELREQLEFVLVDTADEVLLHALDGIRRPRRSTKKPRD
ncbi:MAG: endopeptidase La [Chloroflexota bacterium]